MPRCFFDLVDAGRLQKNDTGTEFSDPDDVRHAAMKYLPDVGRADIPKNGDFRSIVVIVRDDHGRPVYTATLTFTGLWLVS